MAGGMFGSIICNLRAVLVYATAHEPAAIAKFKSSDVYVNNQVQLIVNHAVVL